MLKVIEKTLSLDSVELKTDGEAGTFRGYASKFNGIDSYGDTILPGAYQKAIADGRPVPIFLNHYTDDLPIGKYTAVKENAQGLYVEGQLTLSIQRARDVYEAMKAGTIDGLSVGLLLSRDDYEWKGDGTGGRVIKSVTALREISVCTFPADKRARIGLVKTETLEKAETIRDLEDALRDAGFSKSEALSFISKAKAIILSEKTRRDSDENAEAKLAAGIVALAARL